MKLSAAVIAAVCAATEVIVGSEAGVATCSSLNGPFCAELGSGFVAAPPHARQNLDIDAEKFSVRATDIDAHVQEVAVTETAKNLKIEKVLKEYELQADAIEEAALKEEEDIILDIEMLLDESMTLLSELEENDSESPMAGAFAFSSDNGAFELLERMDGDELKEFFETALDEVLLSVEAALQELSPDAAQGVRTTARQLKALKDFTTYKFQRLDESQLATIRHKFTNHRLVELQQAFESLVIARDAQERQLAFEAAVFVFQLAQEEAMAKESTKEPEADTTTAVSDTTGE